MKTRSWMMIVLIAALAGTVGCGASQKKPLEASMAQPVVPAQNAPQQLKENHFESDRTGNVTEEQLRKILESEVFLEEDPRLGIVPVATAYEVDEEVPVTSVPHALSDALEDTGFFEVTTEVSTDWPADRSIAGLRELAARYRANYLLLYRHRFVDRSFVNGWGWTYPTVIGIFAAPGRTLEVAGVMEATLFDPRTGTILFTAYERVHEKTTMNIWHNEAKQRDIKERLLTKATEKLADDVTHKVRRLVAARPDESNRATAVR